MNAFKIKPAESITVDLDGREVVLTRSELDQDEQLRHYLQFYDNIREDMAEHSYEGEKLKHAETSVKMQMMYRAKEYAKEKYSIKNKESNDE